MKTRYLIKLNGRKKSQTIGSKAANLQKLIRKGLCVPETFVIQSQAFSEYRANNLEMVPQVMKEIAQKLNPEKSYAVRSSANMEDTLEFSFAGQFKSILHVKGFDNIMHSVWSIWATVDSDVVESYLGKSGKRMDDLEMAVIIQEMVNPVISGVAFSKNPTTGMNEIIIEAVHGDGSALVQDGCTPYRWVNRWGKWVSIPSEVEISMSLAEEVARGTRHIADQFAKNVDLEWVYDGKEIFWVQMREITTIKDTQIYSNKMAREMLPGVIKPLIWSINIPLVNGAWINILSELIGKNDLTPEKLAKAFHYRAYFNMETLGSVFNRLGLPQESLEMMMGIESEESRMPSFKPNPKMMVLIPRLVGFMFDKLRFSQKIRRFLPVIEAAYRKYKLENVAQLDESTLVSKIDELFVLSQKLAYFNIVGPLLMMFYSGVLQGQLKKVGIDYKDFDLLIDANDLVRYDPNPHFKRLNEIFNKLDSHTQVKILSNSFQAFQRMEGISEFQEAVYNFMDHFGHLSDSGNDFSKVTWREKPELILNLIANYQSTEEKIVKVMSYERVPFRGFHRWVVSHIYRQTREFMLYREQISFVYTFGYGLFRDYFLGLADHFVRRNVIDKPADIFCLYYSEIKEIVESDTISKNYREMIEKRKLEMEKSEDYYLPPIIFGDHVAPICANDLRKLTGVSTSGGYYTGKVKVVNGIADFHKIEKGDILVVPFTDVSWTPLFASAGGVISESGGMLSHSSIIAREYKIPAVVSVDGATLLEDESLVTVDGYKGEVIVHDDPLR